MTIKTISGTYASGYVLQAPTTILSVTSSGYIGGNGVSILGSGSYAVNNSGTINGSAGIGISMLGGSVINGAPDSLSATIEGQEHGVLMGALGTIFNFGTVKSNGYSSTGGYEAVFLADGGSIVNGVSGYTSATISGVIGVRVSAAPGQITNYGTIKGGQGRQYQTSVYLDAGGQITNGGVGDYNARLLGRVFVGGQGTVSNYGAIIGSPTGGGVAVDMAAASANIVTNGSATDPGALIYGYVGMSGGALTNYGTIVEANYLTCAVAMSGPGTVTNFGTIDSQSSNSYRPKTGGVELLNGGVVINGTASDRTSRIIGAVGVYLAGAGTVTNFGTITGQFGKAAILASAADRFIVEAYSMTQGVVLASGGGTLELAARSGTITSLGMTGPGAAATISGAETMTFTGFDTYNVDAKTSWMLLGTDNVRAGQTLTADGTLFVVGTLTSAGALAVAGTVGGNGTLVVTGGTTAIDAGAAVSVAHWTLAGGVVNLGEALVFTRAFTEVAGATLTIAAGDALTLTATSVLGGVMNGAGAVSVTNAMISRLTIGGTVGFSVGGTVNQGGTVTIGDAGAGAASLTIQKTGVWKIGAGGIARGAASGSKIIDYGLLIKNAGMGLRKVGVDFTDNGVVEAAFGKLDFTRALSGNGVLKIDAKAALEANSGVANTLSVNFNGGAATLVLKTPKTFAATIGGFAATDVIDLLGRAATGASLKVGDKLVIVNGMTTVATLQLTGTYTGAIFGVGSDGKGGTDITLVSGLQAPSPHLMATAMAGMAPMAGITAPPIDPSRLHSSILARPHTNFV